MNKFEQNKALVSVIAGTTVSLYLSYKIIISLLGKNKLYRKLPEPGSAYPYVGHMFSLGDLPGETVSQWHKKLGPIIKFRMGVQTWVSIDCPIIAHKLLVTNGTKTSQRPVAEFTYHVYSMEGKGVIYSHPNAAWKKIRAAVASAIAPSQVSLHIAFIQNEARKLVDQLLSTSAESDTGFYPFKDLQLYIMNNVMLVGFGKTFSSKDDPEFIKLSKTVDEGFELAGLDYDLANYFPIISIYDYFKGTRASLTSFATERRDPLYRKMIKEGLESDGPNLVKYLKESDYELSEEETIVTLSDLIAAGTDTNTVYLCWTIAILCHYPEVQERVSAEIDAFVQRNGRLPLFTERLELPFCISVMKECMRFKPITTFGIPHYVNEDVEIDGYIIPKGTTIISNMTSMHKNSDFYPDRPNEFVPERFMDALGTSVAASAGKVEDRDHFNFGWGRRVCPAIHLSEVETFFGFTELMSRCFIEPAKDGMPNIKDSINGGIAILPLPYKVKFTKRNTSAGSSL